ncbi:MAG: proton-conducting transporter membrane subunit, partial [Mycobacterium leprae]
MKVATYLGGIWSVLLLIGALLIGRTVIANGPLWAMHDIIYIDLFGALMLCLIAFVGVAATFYSATYMRHEAKHGHATEGQVLRYWLWLHLFIIIMMGAVVVENLGFLWVTIEATTLVSALLVGFHNRRNALEAAWKYVILCGVGIAFAMLGLILLYSAGVRAGLDPAEALRWTKLVGAAKQLDKASVRMAFALVLVGYGTKAGLAPMHAWQPDAYSQAPAPVTVLLSMLGNTALYAILRFHVVAVGTLGPAFSSHLLLALGLVS